MKILTTFKSLGKTARTAALAIFLTACAVPSLAGNYSFISINAGYSVNYYPSETGEQECTVGISGNSIDAYLYDSLVNPVGASVTQTDELKLAPGTTTGTTYAVYRWDTAYEYPEYDASITVSCYGTAVVGGSADGIGGAAASSESLVTYDYKDNLFVETTGSTSALNDYSYSLTGHGHTSGSPYTYSAGGSVCYYDGTYYYEYVPIGCDVFITMHISNPDDELVPGTASASGECWITVPMTD